MKLEDLYRRQSLLTEDYRYPEGMNPQRALNTDHQGIVAGGPFTSLTLQKEGFVDYDEVFERIRALQKEGNTEEALRIALAILTKSHISGLSRQQVRTPQGAALHIRGDIDNMKWLNDKSGLGHSGTNLVIQQLGLLIMKHVEGQPDIDLAGASLNFLEGKDEFDPESGTQTAKISHPHGDEFEGVVNLDGLSPEQVGYVIAKTVAGLMRVADELNKTPFFLTQQAKEARDLSQAVRPTVSFGLSMRSGDVADKIVQQSKAKGARYAVTVDVHIMNKYFRSGDKRLRQGLMKMMDRTQGASVQVGVPVREAKNKQLEAVMFRPGCLLLELDYDAIPRHEMLDLENKIRDKRAYLENPKGYCPVKGPNGYDYLPLKEPYI